MLRDLIQQLDNQTNAARRALIENQLTKLGCPYVRQEYTSGTNLLVDLGPPGKKTGVGTHFDRVATSAGANDNGSAIAVALDLVRRHRAAASDLGLRVFFFDEEETGLCGSRAYVAQYGVRELAGLLNMELVGLGDQFALWPVAATATGHLLQGFEAAARRQGVGTRRFDQIVTNTADHVPFRQAGLADAFTITCISEQDVAAATQYYQALASNASRSALMELLTQAPVFEHYHQPTDTYEKLSEATLARTSAAVWETLVACR